MWKTFAQSTHISQFSSKDYWLDQMNRYWDMLQSLRYDSMLDDEDLLDAIKKTKSILENEIQSLMRKWYKIPSTS